ncbi:actin-related protein 10 [Prorops nasuta]|uniref:actin-related protein 10 n=1 Tax=Prorops nasuta TaxID=863751 RepID=UPI0034CD37DC
MPLPYEGVRFITDKQMVIFDVGSAYTKYGFAGEPNPRGIIRSCVKMSMDVDPRNIHSYTNAEDLYQLLVEFFHILFFRQVMVSPKDSRVLILESLLSPTQFRDTLAKVLFQHFEIGSLILLPGHLATISTLGINTALVLDVGYQGATLIPIYEGVPILKAWQSLPLGGQAIHQKIKKELEALIPNINLSENTIEDIKVRTCFVTTLERSLMFKEDGSLIPPPSVIYPGTRNFVIPGHIRERVFEILWARDADNLSIPTMILDSLKQCPIDTRHALAENILLVGGTTMSKGFAARLKSELINLLTSDLYSEKLKVQTFKFHTAPSKPNYTSWLGGAIFGVANLPSRCITKENYLQIKRVPDWANLMDNLKEDFSTCKV